jgi:hypothetical protein
VSWVNERGGGMESATGQKEEGCERWKEWESRKDGHIEGKLKRNGISEGDRNWRRNVKGPEEARKAKE